MEETYNFVAYFVNSFGSAIRFPWSGIVTYVVNSPPPSGAGRGPAPIPRSGRVSPGRAFEPSRLRLARELREWSQADLAKQLSVTPAAVSQYEAGANRPAAETIARMSAVLEVPEGFMELAPPEEHEGFFRSLRRTSVAHRRRARGIALVVHDIVQTAGDVLPELAMPNERPVALNAEIEEIERIAEGVRKDLDLPPGPTGPMVALLESRGAIVIRLPLDTADVDAFSLPFRDRPIIVLGSDKNDRARSRFDAAHELGHLVLHGDRVWGMKEVEQQAHAFAAAFLMPAADIADQLPQRADWDVLFELKLKWQVSIAALLMRARRLGRMSETAYINAVKAASARGWRRTEPVPLGAPERPTSLACVLRTGPGQDAMRAQPATIVEALIAAA
jgi:Zn-dependent peptidase ImmA (M78 family)/DNA-binding XRE family transcriptional regulator